MKEITLDEQIRYARQELCERADSLQCVIAERVLSKKQQAERRKDIRTYDGILKSLLELKRIKAAT